MSRWPRRRVRTGRALTICALASAILSSGSLAGATPSVRVDLESFWYEQTPPPVPISENGPWVLERAGERVLAAVSEILLSHPADFPQPPPLDIVVRAHPREALEGTLGIVAETTSYGGAKLEGDTAFIDVHRSVFGGWRALNDAELRSLIGHELVHAYQFAAGADANEPELWRREVEAYVWEAQHMGTGVRPWYREDSLTSLAMYLELLRDR